MTINFFIDGDEVAGVSLNVIPRVGDTVDFRPDLLYVNEVRWVLTPGRKPYVNVYTSHVKE